MLCKEAENRRKAAVNQQPINTSSFSSNGSFVRSLTRSYDGIRTNGEVLNGSFVRSRDGDKQNTLKLQACTDSSQEGNDYCADESNDYCAEESNDEEDFVGEESETEAEAEGAGAGGRTRASQWLRSMSLKSRRCISKPFS